MAQLVSDKELRKMQTLERRFGGLLAPKQELYIVDEDGHGPGQLPASLDKRLRGEQPNSKSGVFGVDGDRKYPVDQFIVHHSVGPEFRNTDHSTIRRWYSNVGAGRSYAGYAHSGHFVEGYETFACAQWAGHWHDGVTRSGYCIFDLFDDPWNNVAWHAGNWPINQRGMGLENCGRFNLAGLPEKALMELADKWRPQDRALGGKTNIQPHRAVSQTGTACPELLGNQINIILDMVNNPDPWNARLYPAPAPPAPKDWEKNSRDVTEVWWTKPGAKLFDIPTNGAIPNVAAYVNGSFPANTKFDIGRRTQAHGVDWLITKSSANAGAWRGVRVSDMANVDPSLPPPDNRTEWEKNQQNFAVQKFHAKRSTVLMDIATNTKIEGVSAYVNGVFPIGTGFDITRKTKAHGIEFLITKSSAELNKWRGVPADDLSTEAPKPPEPPKPPVPVEPTKQERINVLVSDIIVKANEVKELNR